MSFLRHGFKGERFQYIIFNIIYMFICQEKALEDIGYALEKNMLISNNYNIYMDIISESRCNMLYQ